MLLVVPAEHLDERLDAREVCGEEHKDAQHTDRAAQAHQDAHHLGAAQPQQQLEGVEAETKPAEGRLQHGVVVRLAAAVSRGPHLDLAHRQDLDRYRQLPPAADSESHHRTGCQHAR